MRAVLFDVDGTLVDSLPALTRGLGDAYERFSGVRPPEPQLRELVGMSLREQMKLYGNPSANDEELDAMCAFTIARFGDYESLETEFHEAVEALMFAKTSGLATALVTSKSRPELNRFQLRFSAWHAVDIAVCSSDVSAPKPHPESAILACERLSIRPEEACFVGDSIYDIRCAKAAGVPVVAVSYGAGPRHALEAEQPDLILDSPRQLREWIQSQF